MKGFQKLKQEEDNFPLPPAGIEQSLLKQISAFKTLGHAIDMTFPKMLSTLIRMFGGVEPSATHKHQAPSTFKDPLADGTSR